MSGSVVRPHRVAVGSTPKSAGGVEPEEARLQLVGQGRVPVASWNSGVISKARIAMICGSGLPYQMASVPHMHPLRTHPAEQLAEGVGGLIGLGEQLAPQGGDVDPDVVVGRDVVAVEGGQQRVDADGGARVVRALDVGGVPGGVVHDELHVGELARDRHDVVGVVEGGVEVHEREALVGHEDLDAEVVGVLDGGQADGRVLERVALPARAPRRVHLERRRWTARHRARHLLERRSTGPTLGAMMFSTSRRLAPPPVRPAVICCGAEGVGERDRAHWTGPSWARRSASATVVSLARKRSCR